MSVIVQSRPATVTTTTVSTTVTLSPPNHQACDLAARLAGQTIRLPNLKKHLVDWPSHVNKNLLGIRPQVDQMLERIIDSERKLQGLKACDFGFLASSIFADTSAERLPAAALFLVWIFIWDDEIDHGEGENGISTDAELARKYCTDSLEYMHWGLGLSDEKEPVCSISNMCLFKEFSASLNEGMDLSQRQSIFDELSGFVQECLIEQTGQQFGHIPTLDQYISNRLGTSGISPGLPFAQFTSEVKLPRHIIGSPEMRALWKETTILCMMINDMYSMKKEVKSGALQNMIPVMINERPHASVESIMGDFEARFASSARRFDESYHKLDERTLNDEKLNRDLATYVTACRHFVTGLLEWSLMTRRYGIKSFLEADGSALVCL